MPRPTWKAWLPVTLVLMLALEGWLWTSLHRFERAWIAGTEAPFSVGTHLRETLHRLDSAILRFQLSGDGASRDEFAKDTRRFDELLSHARPGGAAGTQDQPYATDVKRAFNGYLADTKDLLQRGVRGLRRETPAEIEGLVRDKSRFLQEALARLIDAEDRARAGWLEEERQSLRRLKRAVWQSGAATILGVALCAWIFRRALVVPQQAADPQTEAALLRQERLASLGVLAAGVAHEIRNPLTALKFRLYSLKKALPAPLADHADLGILSKEINRLERIVKDFLEFARPSEPRRVEIVGGEVLQELHDLWRVDLDKRGIQVRLEVDPTARLWADRQQIQQVLINLLQNAAESTPPGGTITLAVRQGAAKLSKRTEPVILFEVGDTGKGISAEAEPRIFDPFFSTKEGGSGLGLPTAARIAEMHGGYIQFASQPGRGATFTVALPKGRHHESEHPADRR